MLRSSRSREHGMGARVQVSEREDAKLTNNERIGGCTTFCCPGQRVKRVKKLFFHGQGTRRR
jgi:hypothetical protein